jgi:pimeloyl-ACP methyl ester carboxylesterase
LRTLWPTSSAAAVPQLISLPGLGHLAHEEQPELVSRHVLAQFKALQGE